MIKNLILFTFFATFVGLSACEKDENTNTTPLSTTVVNLPASLADIKTPADNPLTVAKINLGRLLFWDPILSGNKDLACVTCHHPNFGYAENLDISIGSNGIGLGNLRHFQIPNTIAFVKRNAHSVLNTAFNGMDDKGVYDPSNAPMFWDGRKNSLELQSLEPIKSLEEMRGRNFTDSTALDSVVARLKNIAEYRKLFALAFGSELTVNADNIGKAIASFERSLVANNSPFDRYKNGETSAMTATQIAGMQSFKNIGCDNCHSGPMFSDYKLHVLSVPDNAKLTTSDNGANGLYAFRTPSLRNLKFTAPYMHSGRFATLDLVLNFYDNIADGRSQNSNVKTAQIDPKIRDLNVRNFQQNTAQIVAFLQALSDDNYDKMIPASVPSQLSVGGNIK